MYKCNKCGNIESFEEINVMKTYVSQGKEEKTYDEFFYKENTICLECEATEEDGNIISINE